MIFKKWLHQILHCSRLSDKDITDYFMMKIDEFSATNHNPNTSCKIHGDCIIADPRKKSWIYLSLALCPCPKLLDALEANYGTNFPAALLVLGGYILAIHYMP